MFGFDPGDNVVRYSLQAIIADYLTGHPIYRNVCHAMDYRGQYCFKSRNPCSGSTARNRGASRLVHRLALIRRFVDLQKHQADQNI